VIDRVVVAVAVEVHALTFPKRFAAQPLAGDGVEISFPKVVEPRLLIEVFGGVAPRVAICERAGCCDFLSEWAVGVFGEEVLVDVCESDDMTGAVI